MPLVVLGGETEKVNGFGEWYLTCIPLFQAVVLSNLYPKASFYPSQQLAEIPFAIPCITVWDKKAPAMRPKAVMAAPVLPHG